MKNTSLPLTRKHLFSALQADETLQSCFNRVVSADQPNKEQQAYIVKQDVLMHQWSLSVAESAVKQIAMPTIYRHKVLSLAHESQWLGHVTQKRTGFG